MTKNQGAVVHIITGSKQSSTAEMVTDG